MIAYIGTLTLTLSPATESGQTHISAIDPAVRKCRPGAVAIALKTSLPLSLPLLIIHLISNQRSATTGHGRAAPAHACGPVDGGGAAGKVYMVVRERIGDQNQQLNPHTAPRRCNT